MSWTTRLLAPAALALTLSALAAPVALNGAFATGLTGIGWDGKPVSTVTATASGRPLGGGIGWDGVGASVGAPTGASLGDGIGWD
ncbi:MULTISPECIES: hypothetical protein [unclassified Streptomyces]|uniref:hypothetical protein n=1 Tax=unclassified Streptomyces TaxID=2593676 RepID=UPI002254978F|nr:hypothetical protein [Streptomyces sp. NBC_00320]MCX5151799.1 hypothetical protein [Streptomyces sp. NBC_00320]WSW64482.1 hypothetical protein OG513_38715 [Streptomyces sp. NBC_00998]